MIKVQCLVHICIAFFEQLFTDEGSTLSLCILCQGEVSLVKQKKVEEALEMAEMERNRAISDALMQREVSRQVLIVCRSPSVFSFLVIA